MLDTATLWNALPICLLKLLLNLKRTMPAVGLCILDLLTLDASDRLLGFVAFQTIEHDSLKYFL